MLLITIFDENSLSPVAKLPPLRVEPGADLLLQETTAPPALIATSNGQAIVLYQESPALALEHST